MSEPALKVWLAGLDLWKYYFQKIGQIADGGAPKDTYNQNASFYDIKEFFKGRKESTDGKTGKMNNKSNDKKFNELESALTAALHALANHIEPKIYEYGFLRK
ncbi:hypothetical protein FACS18945_6230 [Bacteroidia bacterium]|nr:hypothetical protein FACS18945_6230 [Bacteroidia bacterium]